MNIETLIAIASVAITVISMIVANSWKVATRYGELMRRIDKLEYDLNNLREINRRQIHEQVWRLQMQITHVQEHLEGVTEYHAPSLQREE